MSNNPLKKAIERLDQIIEDEEGDSDLTYYREMIINIFIGLEQDVKEHLTNDDTVY